MNEKHELQMLPETSGRLPKSVEEFERNYEREHPGSAGCFHNIYHLVSEDRDGNITGEAFGLNVTTDYGFEHMYKIETGHEDKIDRVYLGDGIFETIDYASSSMVHAISSTSGTIIGGSWFMPEHMNTKWIPEKESNKVTIKLCECYFDYTVWPEDHTVTEIGLSSFIYSGISQLKYHAAIYDSEGHKSSFVKHVNEKLTIKVYGRWMVPIVKIINQSWDNGIPAVIRSAGLWQEAYYNAPWTTMCINFYPYNQRNGWYNATSFKGYNDGAIVDHVYSTDKTQSMNVFIDNQQQYVSERVFNSAWTDDGKYVQYNSYFLFVSKIYAPEPIPFQQDFFRWLGYNCGTLEKTYCRRSENSVKDPTGQLPMTNIHITSLTMYNGQTDDWDIDVPYTEPIPYLEHGYQHLRFRIREQNWITFLDDYKWYTVYINEAPQYPISKIHSCDRTMYVTDAYWDSSTWEIVPNTNNISRAQGAKRFFIMFDEKFSAWVSDYDVGYYAYDDYARLVSRYDYSNKFPVINTNNGSWEDHAVLGKYFNDYSDVEYYYSDRDAGKAINNETYNYFAQNGILVYPESIDPNPARSGWEGASYTGNLSGVPYRYTIGGINLNGDFPTGRHLDGAHANLIWNTTRGGHIICAGNYSNNAGCRVYTISADPSQAPTYDDFTYDAVWNNTPGWTHTDNGYLVVSYISGNTNVNETYVFAYDVPNETPSMYKVTGYHHAFAIDLTNYFVAIDANVTDHLHMVIYDMANQTVHDEFDIPAGYTFQGIAAWKNFIYIRVDQSGAKSTYVYYIQQHMLELTPLDLDIMIFDTDSYEYHIQRAVEGSGNIESCMILFASGKYEHQSKAHMLFKESDPTHPEEIIFKENLETSSYVRRQKAWLGYTADKKQLICCYAGRRSISLDISWNLKHGAQTNYRSWASHYQSNSDRFSPIYHKGYCYLLRLCWNSDTNDTSHGWSQKPTISDFYRYPYQQWMSMRIIGTTYTPNSMMNPVRIKGNIGRSWFSSTNRDVDVAPPHYDPNT